MIYGNSYILDVIISVREALEAEVKMIPDTYTAINEDDAKKFQKMLDLLDDDDDIQEVYHN